MPSKVDRAQALVTGLGADTDLLAALQADGFEGWDEWLRRLAAIDPSAAQACMVVWASAFVPACPTLVRDPDFEEEPPLDLTALVTTAQRELVGETGFKALAKAFKEDPHGGEDIASWAGDGGAYDAGVVVWFALEAVVHLRARKPGRAGEAAGNAALGAQSVFEARGLGPWTAELLARSLRLALEPWFEGGEPDYPALDAR